MSELRGGAEPGWWSRIQQVVAALVALSGEIAKLVDCWRRIFR